MTIQIRTSLAEPEAPESFVPHRPARPEKHEGGKRFKIASDYEPAGDQPTMLSAADIEPWVAANAMMGVHRRLVDYARERIAAGARHARLSREVLEQADAALSLLERGLAGYAVKEP